MKKDLWAGGKYADLWSVVHTLSGVFAGVVALFINLSFATALVLFLILAILWEGFEFWFRIRETSQNRVTDILFGVSGFMVSYYGLLTTGASYRDQWYLGLGLGLVLIIMNWLGRRAYLKRSR